MPCDSWFSHDKVQPCVFGSDDAKKTVILLGDSIGVQWFSLIALSHLHQFVPGVEDVFEVGFQQISLWCLALIPWDHGYFFRFLSETERFMVDIIPRIHDNSLHLFRFFLLQGRLSRSAPNHNDLGLPFRQAI